MASTHQQEPLLPTSPPTTYFDLIEKVGAEGKYQIIVMLISSLAWFVTGILLLGTGFIYYNPAFDC